MSLRLNRRSKQKHKHVWRKSFIFLLSYNLQRLDTHRMTVIIQDVAVIIIIFSLKKKENMNLWFLF